MLPAAVSLRKQGATRGSKFFFPESFVKAHPEVLAELFAAFWDNAPKLEPYLEHVIARNRHETGEYLHKITCPTLCIVGSEDKVHADTGNHVTTTEHLRDNIKGAEMKVDRRLRPRLFLAKAGGDQPDHSRMGGPALRM